MNKTEMVNHNLFAFINTNMHYAVVSGILIETVSQQHACKENFFIVYGYAKQSQMVFKLVYRWWYYNGILINTEWTT